MKLFDEKLEGFLIAERLRGRKIDSFGLNCYGYRVKSSIVLAETIEIFPKGIAFMIDGRPDVEIAKAYFNKIKGVTADWRSGRHETFRIEIKAEPDIVLELVKHFEEHAHEIKGEISAEIVKRLQWDLEQAKKRQREYEKAKKEYQDASCN